MRITEGRDHIYPVLQSPKAHIVPGIYCVCLAVQSLSTVLQPHRWSPGRLLCPWDFPGKNTGVCYHFLFQEIFPTQGWNPHLLQWQADSLPLHHLGCTWYILGPQLTSVERRTTDNEEWVPNNGVGEWVAWQSQLWWLSILCGEGTPSGFQL